MNKISSDDIQIARNTDIADWLQKNGEQTKKEGEWFVWQSHIAIKKNFYHDRYKNANGDAIDFLMSYFDMDFQSAVRTLLNDAYEFVPKTSVRSVQPLVHKDFFLPSKNDDSTIAKNYLIYTRHISPEVLEPFFDNDLIYENEYMNCHNVVFVGRDASGNDRHAHIRGISSIKYRRDQAGSDKRFSFNWVGNNNIVYLFEAPIDLLSYICLHTKKWKDNSYVAACGVSDEAILQFLRDHSNITHIYLCLDNDEQGKKANEKIKQTLISRGYDVSIILPKNKDWNEDLLERN